MSHDLAQESFLRNLIPILFDFEKKSYTIFNYWPTGETIIALFARLYFVWFILILFHYLSPNFKLRRQSRLSKKGKL